MKVTVIGTGYVGLVSGTCFSELGHHVTCLDINEEKIKGLLNGVCPIYEPGLPELIKRNVELGRLSFSSNYEVVKEGHIIFLAVGTPSTPKGNADLTYLFSAAESLIPHFKPGSIIVIKSTVPVGTAHNLENFLKEKTSKEFHVVNNPEFLKEGTAVDDFMRPDRVVIGTKEKEVAQTMEELYAPLVRQGNPIYTMSNLSAELTKYAANGLLAIKISFINEMAKLCDAMGADIEEVRHGITSDRRIGPHFLYPGPGYGGSCFPKDVKALYATGVENDLKLHMLEATEKVNQVQKTYLFEKIKRHFKGQLEGKKFAFWGVAFKPKTDDIRESSAIDMAKALIEEKALVSFYDPVAQKNFQDLMKLKDLPVQGHKDMYECLEGVDGLVVLTDWPEFKAPEFDQMKEKMKEKNIFDGRNLYSVNKILDHGFTYYAMGRRIERSS